MVCPMENVYVVMGRMWIATDPGTRMYLKVHQRVTFVFRDTEDGLTCSHIHCSNPYQEMLDGESFPEKIGRQSYEYVQERLNALEEETKQQNRQLEVIMSSIAGGLKISNDDETYSFAFVSREAAALFGYTVEEFMEVTGGRRWAMYIRQTFPAPWLTVPRPSGTEILHIPPVTGCAVGRKPEMDH